MRRGSGRRGRLACVTVPGSEWAVPTRRPVAGTQPRLGAYCTASAAWPAAPNAWQPESGPPWPPFRRWGPGRASCLRAPAGSGAGGIWSPHSGLLALGLVHASVSDHRSAASIGLRLQISSSRQADLTHGHASNRINLHTNKRAYVTSEEEACCHSLCRPWSCQT